jgi:hypothetical protein
VCSINPLNPIQFFFIVSEDADVDQAASTLKHPNDSQGMQTPFGKSPFDLQQFSIAKVGSQGLAKVRKPEVFGQSSLPAIPKYALKSTTESLPSFEKASWEKPCCYICRDTEQKHLFPFGGKHRTCRSCRRFFLQKAEFLLSGHVRFTCEYDGMLLS